MTVFSESTVHDCTRGRRTLHHTVAPRQVPTLCSLSLGVERRKFILWGQLQRGGVGTFYFSCLGIVHGYWVSDVSGAHAYREINKHGAYRHHIAFVERQRRRCLQHHCAGSAPRSSPHSLLKAIAVAHARFLQRPCNADPCGSPDSHPSLWTRPDECQGRRTYKGGGGRDVTG